MQTAVKLLALTIILSAGCSAAAEWEPAPGRLMSRFAEDVDPAGPLPEYPRPQMVRDKWLNLNGLWQYAVGPKAEDRPETFDGELPKSFDGEILVPFPIESSLSGVMKRVGEDQRLWYRRAFRVPGDWDGQRVLLHFGAVDWEATVWVDGRKIGTHRGGYDPFVFDVTDALAEGAEHELIVSVWDPTDAGTQPRGKQVNRPGGIWYTPTTGIWQTVWLEPVPQASLVDLRLVPDVDNEKLQVTALCRYRGSGFSVKAIARDGDRQVAEASGKPGQPIDLTLDNPKLWSPDSPQLYDLEVTLIHDGQPVDTVKSYFGMRKIALGQDERGITRMFFNGQPVFQFGPLDQGFWPDGLYTAPTDEALRYDIEMTKKLGFNMVRKHVKVEPARWYYWCDRLGLLVWQDLPNGDKHAPWPHDGREITRSEESTKQYNRELKALVDTHFNCPSIVMWVPFNEAWGQFDTRQTVGWLKSYDPSRLVNSASGGNDYAVGDVHDVHLYPGPDAPPAQVDRAAILGEYGGLGLPLPGHTLLDKKNWGYVSYKNADELTDAYLALLDKMRPMIDSHLSAAIYTQTTDVEVEVNGLMTYDRVITKMDVEKVAEANRQMYLPPKPIDASARAVQSAVAYWRFEDAEPGQLVGNVTDAPKKIGVRDISGHTNHLYAFAKDNAPKFSSDVPAGVVPLTGEKNVGSLDDRAAPGGSATTRDLFTDHGRVRGAVNLNTFQFAQWTVEASLQVAELGRRHVIVGKDGSPDTGPPDTGPPDTGPPDTGPVAPLQVAVNNDGKIEIVAIDSKKSVRCVTGLVVEPDRWYHVAAVCDGKTLKLLVNDGHGYVRQGETTFDGQLLGSTGTWTLGRGWADGALVGDARAVIDEVRISAIALPIEQLLFSGKE